MTRFVDPDGKPFSGDFSRIASLMIVVTPGVSKFDWQVGRRQEELVADEGFLSNFDRRHHWEEPVPDAQQGKVNELFRAYRYAPDYSGLDGQVLTPGDYIELPGK